jgi:hypothetical protein
MMGMVCEKEMYEKNIKRKSTWPGVDLEWHDLVWLTLYDLERHDLIWLAFIAYNGMVLHEWI